MIVIRFQVTCQPGKVEHALAVFAPVVAPSRALPGVVSFDIARDIVDPDSIVAVEVFADADAMARQDALPEVAKVMSVLPQLVAVAPQATIFHVSSTQDPFAATAS
jgi:quinol monooxygenase YgiN